MAPSPGQVQSVSFSNQHTFSKTAVPEITLLAGLGVAGDAHMGITVKHRSRVARDPAQPNLRQVHLIHAELLDELRQKGFAVRPGELGENVTVRGIDLLGLPTGAVLNVGAEAVIQITGLRNPCAQINAFQAGLLNAVLDRDQQSQVVRKAGVMAIVLTGGLVSVGDPVHVTLPPEPHRPLEPV